MPSFFDRKNHSRYEKRFRYLFNFQKVSKKQKNDDLNELFLPRKLCRSNCSTLEFVSGYDEKSDAVDPYYPTTVKEPCKDLYFVTINAVHNALKERFEQPKFINFLKVEQLLLKSINGESYEKEYDDLLLVYADDVETTLLPSELLTLPTMFESLAPVHFGNIVEN